MDRRQKDDLNETAFASDFCDVHCFCIQLSSSNTDCTYDFLRVFKGGVGGGGESKLLTHRGLFVERHDNFPGRKNYFASTMFLNKDSILIDLERLIFNSLPWNTMTVYTKKKNVMEGNV